MTDETPGNDDLKPAHMANGIRVMAVEVPGSCECHKNQTRTAVSVLLETDEDARVYLLDEDSVSELIGMLARARDFSTTANMAREQKAHA